MITVPQPQLLDAYNRLPRPVREYLVSPQFANDMQAIGTTYHLHVDTIGQLSLATGYLLSGLVKPAEVLGELTALGVVGATANGVMDDLNKKIFQPLHDKVRGAPDDPTEQRESASVSATPASAPKPGTPTPPTASASQAVPIQKPAPILPGSDVSVPLVAPPPRAPMPPPQPRPAAPTAPSPAFQAPRPAPQPSQPPAKPANSALHDVLKSYGVDPYREAPE